MTVKQGQVWQDNDPRGKGRKVQVVAPRPYGCKWTVRNLATGRQTRILEERLLRGGRTGYTLVKEAPAA